MAAPDNVRVEAIAPGTTILRWTYSGASALKVYRSTDGASYSVITTLTSSDTQYIDIDLAEKTKYWYKISDDNGSTFSAIVTVVTYVLDVPRNRVNQTALNTFTGDQTDLQWQLQEANNKQVLEKTPCDVCLVEGAMILDCSSGCNWFRIVVDQDINSISIIGCEACPPCDFIIPPGETFGLCGWPIGCEYTRDECFEAPVSGGTGGRTAKTNGLSYGGYGSTGGGPSIPTQSCPCDSALDHNCTTDCLRIICCDQMAECAIDCGERLRVKACGGLGPYTWSKTGNVTLSATTGTAITVTSTQSAGGNVPGCCPGDEAWVRVRYTVDFQFVALQYALDAAPRTDMITYDCDLNVLNTAATIASVPAVKQICAEYLDVCPDSACTSGSTTGVVDSCASQPTARVSFSYNPGGTVWSGAASYSENFSPTLTTGQVFQLAELLDIRTQAMIDAGCGDVCSQGTTTLTCTDATGTQSTVILHA